MTAKLKRETFKTSRELDFFSEKELVAQTGHDVREWPLVALKELIDNALDVCEEHDIPPVVEVAADACGLSVSDNGPGLPDETIAGVLDYSVRTSSREAYVSPTRGAQGNALKTLVAMPYVVDPSAGKLVVKSCGKRREIRCACDPVTQRAVIHSDESPANGKPGTLVRLEWAPRANDHGLVWPFAFAPTNVWHRQRAYELLRGFSMFNPHLTLKVDWFGERWTIKATKRDWRKWKPSHPTSSHWYEQRHLERLIGAYIALDQDRKTTRTVAGFVAEFDGLSGSLKRKKVLAECDVLREPLTGLTCEAGFRAELVAKLLKAMQTHTRPVKPPRLGIIGEEHFRTRFQELGCDEKQFKYTKKIGTEDGLPYVIETAFSWRGDTAENRRTLIPGANWSVAIKNPFRSFGNTGEGLEALLTELKVGSQDPIVFALHLAHPRIQYTDRGKSAISMKGGDE